MKVAVRAGIASVWLGAYSQRRLNDYSTQMSSGFKCYIYILSLHLRLLDGTPYKSTLKKKD